ncbi:MAG TPA: CheR family methyltransferase [Candidatus Limnocylindria bacterium]|nr:CheR family methyltransferase [Candidatus Limnocylindria bacterium]
MTMTVASDDALERTAAVLAREAGMACPPARRRDLARAVEDVCRSASIDDAATYLTQIAEHPTLLDDLVGALAVGETYFFRDPDQFALIRSTIIPDLVREHGSALRVWSAGCASGEEAYSIAIALAEAGITTAPPVLGTDISRGALRRADIGTYGQWSFRGAPDARRERYFERDGDRFRIRQEIRARVRFAWLNLASKSYPSLHSGIWDIHLALCRNVLIYLTPEAVAHVAHRLYDALAPGGWLLTSPSDPPLAALAPFVTVATGTGMAYRRPPVDATSALQTDDLPDIATACAEEPASDPTIAAAREQAAARPSPRPEPAARPTTTLETLRARLRTLADRAEHDEVARVLVRAVQAHPLDAELHYLRAIMLLEQGKDGEAAAAARRALYLEPQLAVAAIALGSALHRSADVHAARRAYRSAAALLARRPPDEPVQLGDGERAGGLLRSVESLIALTGSGAERTS